MEVADLVVKFRSDGVNTVTKDVQQVDTSVSSFGAKATQIGGMLTAGVTLPIIALGVGAIKAASNTEEAINKVQVVFGDAGAAVVTWSETSAKAMGISQATALSYSGTLGNMLLNMGFTTDEAANMSTGFVQLSADMASFNNTSPEQALEAIRSALVGEMEPLRQFGVSLNQAKIEAEAMALGLWNGEGAITDSAKAAAVASLIYKETSTAQGDFARTSDSAANQMRILQAQFSDAAATLGTQLLPAATALMGWVSDAITGFSGLDPTIQNVILVVAGLAAAAGPLLVAFGAISMALPALGVAFTLLTGPVGLVVAAIAALFVAYQTNFLGFADGVNAAIDGIVAEWNILKDAFDAEGIGGIFSKLGEQISSIDWEGLGQTIGEGAKSAGIAAMEGLLAGIQEHGVDVVTFFGVDLPLLLLETWVDAHVWLLQTGIDLMVGLFNGITGGWDGSIQPFLASIPGLALELIGDLSSTLWNAGWSLVWGLAQGIYSAIPGILGGAVDAVKGAVGDIIDYIAPGSPSRLFTPVGESIPWGLAAGMKASMPKLNSAIGSVNASLGVTGGPMAPGLPGGRSNRLSSVGGSGNTFIIERGAFVGRGAWAELQTMVNAGGARVVDKRMTSSAIAGARA